MLAAQEASRIAFDLIGKYGPEAIDYAEDRASRAMAVGDDLAHSAWQAVIAAAQALLSRQAAGPHAPADRR